MGYLKLLRTYWSLRPTNCNINRFFLCYKSTGHCLRRTSATLLADVRANMTTLKRHAGWKSSAVAEGYLVDSMSSKNKISKLIAVVTSTRPSTSKNDQSSSISVSENHKIIEYIDLSKAGYKKVIKGVTGKFKSGELTAIMGPSGAGKTSLLNVLTGFQKTGVEGVIKCKHGLKAKRGTDQYRKNSCYILQDDHLTAYFTVEEIMCTTTQLKIDGISKRDRTYLIDEILNTLGLSKQKNTPCGNLSGGQKKRLSIALELIDDPPILFLDEPTTFNYIAFALALLQLTLDVVWQDVRTVENIWLLRKHLLIFTQETYIEFSFYSRTGLDISSTNQCVEMLKYLASKGRTIICTIHQPSSPIYVTFDHVYVMAQGKCVFQGSPLNTIPYLAGLGFICPQYHNPADFLLEVTNCEYGDCIDKLALAAKDLVWRNNLGQQDDKIKKEAELLRKESTFNFSTTEPCARKPPPEWKRFFVLLQKQYVYLYRDWTVSKLKFTLHLLVGIFLGINFQRVGYDASKIITNLSFFMISVVYLSYTALMPAALRFPSEMAIIRKEHFNRWYKLSTFYIACLSTDIPLQVLFTLAYTTGSYIISSQPLELCRFCMVFAIQSMVALIAAGIGLLFGTFCNPVNGTFMGAITTVLSFSVAGFLCLFPDMNRVMYFMSNLSFMSFSMEGLLQAVYGHNRERLVCPEEEEYCLFTEPEQVLKELGMNKLSFWTDFGWLVVNLIVFRLLAFFALKYKLNKS